MSNQRCVLLFSLLILSAAMLFGCSTAQTMKPYANAGFLEDYGRLKPAPAGGEAMVWRKPDVELKQYNKILLERIVVWYKDDTDYKGIDPTDLKALVDYFHKTLADSFGDAYPVVTEPGPDVMRVRIALTELVPTKTSLSVVALVAPYATIPDIASGMVGKGGLGSSPYLGDAAIEAMGLDSMTGTTLWEYVDRRIGKKYDVDLDEGVTGAVKKGFTNYGKAFTTWGYTKQAMDVWARRFRKALDEIHGRQPVTPQTIGTEQKEDDE